MTKQQKIYREAARKVAQGEETFSCVAVARLDGPFFLERAQYGRLFAPVNTRPLVVDDIYDACGDSLSDRDFRVMLLCMMAAVCEDFYPS